MRVDLAYEAGRAPTRHHPEVEAVLYRIVQEALTNIVKHAHAAHAWVDVNEDTAGVRVGARDDGVGFDPAAATGGFGLLGMRERVALVAGTLTVDSRPGAGTTLTVTLPEQRPALNPTLSSVRGDESDRRFA